MKYLVLLFIAFALYYQVHADCYLSKSEVEKETRIFTDTIWNSNQMELFRNDVVPEYWQLHLVCTENDILTTVCYQGQFYLNPLPIANCPSPLKAVVEVVVDSSCQSPFLMYSVGYRINSQFLELYRSCYDKTGVRAKFTVHDAVDYNLVTKRPDQEFVTDGIISPQDASTFKRDKIFYRFQTLLGLKQTYIRNANDTKLHRGHLTPSADYLFIDNMRGTFKYINAVPQFASINIGNWKAIEDWIRKSQLKRTPTVRLCTGAFGILQLRDQNNNLVPIYLGAGNINPIPVWMYKIVSKRAVFLVYNNIYDVNKPTAPCTTVICPNDLKLNASHTAGFTYCCDPQDFINKQVPNLKKNCWV